MTTSQKLKLYDHDFFAWQEDGSVKSARNLLGTLKAHLQTSSVVDVGCGTGGWLKVWQELGVEDVVGVDGAHISDDQLYISPATFERRDLTGPWALSRRFDLVQSMEVAEHLSPETGLHFVKSLCAAGDVVLFSAAQPGQGGEFHVNERPLAYWQGLFESQGYRTFDGIRPRVAKNPDVEMWYRNNTLLFANAEGCKRISTSMQTSECTGTELVTSHGDWPWEMRRAIVRFFPVSFVTRVSKTSYPFKIRLKNWKMARSEGRTQSSAEQPRAQI